MSQPLTLGNLLPAVKQPDKQVATFSKTTFVGIDFGTSTTVVSIASLDPITGNPITKVLSLNQRLPDGALMSSDRLPTVIACYNEQILVGQGAADLKYTLKKGKNVWYSFKMELGEDLGDKYYESVLGINNPSGQTLTKPKDAARIFFRYVKKQIIEEVQKLGLSEYIQYSVSIPASFEANQRRELIEALEANSMQLNRQALIDEPNAAFLSFVKQSEADGNPIAIPDSYNANVLVFDFGAGTCDVSILEIGQGAKGLYSKNLAISEFKKLGGDDIDRYIAVHYLLPQLLEANGLESDVFRTRELNEGIIPALLKSAEQLKIGICKVVGMMASNQELPASATSEKEYKLGVIVRIDTRKGSLELREPRLTYYQFSEAMAVFLKRRNTVSLTVKNSGSDPFISIFNPISSALRKASLAKEDIDYVLFIGGSAQNPYVQDALKTYFDESELLIPQDLQTHVSQGSALHSLMYNGFNSNVIQPITSEPIILITKDTTPRILIPAGEAVPTLPILIDDLITDSQQQQTIELPICVGNVNKMLFNVRISHPDGFAPGTSVQLSLELNPDKLLLIQATAAGRTVLAEPMSPFANRELTTEERAIIQAERQVNLMAAQNGGRPPKDSLQNLARTYEQAEKNLQVAETLEQLIELYPDPSQYNQIGNSYIQAGKTKKATEYYELAHSNDPTSQTLLFNLAHSLKQSDPLRHHSLIEKAYQMNPNDPVTMIEWGGILQSQGNSEYLNLYQKAFDIYTKKYETNSLRGFEHSWFASVADKLGKHALANEIRANSKKQKVDLFFDAQNLTRTRQSENLLD